MMRKKLKRPKESSFNQKPKSKLWSRLSLIIPIITLLSGLYILSLVYAPKLIPFLNRGKVATAIKDSKPELGNDRLYIQKLGINVQIKAGDASVMKTGVWHRFPERGDPVAGGNFIISAHRWHTGKTPIDTVAQSPFYNADRLAVGDEIFVDWQGQRYKYIISKTYQVKPNQVEIEAPLPPGDEPHMTLYTCTLKGSSDGRVVIQAKLANVA